jgi:hypothetical protein
MGFQTRDPASLTPIMPRFRPLATVFFPCAALFFSASAASLLLSASPHAPSWLAAGTADAVPATALVFLLSDCSLSLSTYDVLQTPP